MATAEGIQMTDPKSRVQLPSERIREIAKDNDWRTDGLVRNYPRDLSAHVAELATRLDAVAEYLDERETQLHPIARAHPTGLLRPAVSVSAPTAPPELVAYVRHPDGAKTPITPRQWAQAVLAHPAPTSSPGDDHPDPTGVPQPRIRSPMSPPSEEDPPLPVAHRVTFEVMRERDTLRARVGELEEFLERLAQVHDRSAIAARAMGLFNVANSHAVFAEAYRTGNSCVMRLNGDGTAFAEVVADLETLTDGRLMMAQRESHPEELLFDQAANVTHTDIDALDTRITRLEAEITDARANLTHDGATAAEWASRYADLANAAAGAVGVLAVNDPAQRMVKERLEGVLAGQEERLDWKQAADAFVKQRDEALDAVRDAQAEITQLKKENADIRNEVLNDNARLKEENARLEQTRVNLRKLLDRSRMDGRKRDAVVERAQLVAKLDDTDLHDPNLRMEALRDALSALDRTEGEQAATPLQSPAPVEGVREIRVGSKWRGNFDELIREVMSLEDDGAVNYMRPSDGSYHWADRCSFLRDFTWLSDHEPPAERPLGEEKL